MKRPPAWKLKREVLRLGRDIRDFPGNASMYLFSTAYYDLVLSRQRLQWDGHQPWTDRVAVFMIFPSKGLLESHVDTLRHFADNGYSTVIVSNLPMTDADRDRAKQLCASYIERPNFGYDFGAYRDGVLSVMDRMADLKRLVLVNDSAWYPLPGQRNWLSEAEAMGVDFAGAVSHFGSPRADIENFLDFKWTYSSNRRDFHYASFALSFGPNILRAPSFAAFWRKLRLANKKKHVVRGGEIGITQWAVKNGHTHACMYDPANLDTDLNALSDERLLELASNIIILEHPRIIPMKQELLALARTDPDWRHQITQYILMAASLQGSSYALADMLIKDKGFPFLKKSPLRASRDGADATLRLISDFPKPDIDHIMDEATNL